MLHLFVILVVTLVAKVNFVYTQQNKSIGDESILDNESQDIEPRLKLGFRASLGQFPWMVFIRMRDSYSTTFCGGALVSKRHVLTAGHCCDSHNTIFDSLRVRVGELDLTMDPDCKYSMLSTAWIGFGCHSYIREYRVEKASEFRINDRFPNYDLCLLKTTEDVTYTDYVQPIKLPFESNGIDFSMEGFDDLDLHVTGWGSSVQGETEESMHLMTATVRGMDLELCKDKYHEFFPQTALVLGMDKICAGKSSGKNLCTGDSGDPLTYDYKGQTYLVGIAVGGISCLGTYRPEGLPSFFTRIDWYEYWLTEEMNK